MLGSLVGVRCRNLSQLKFSSQGYLTITNQSKVPVLPLTRNISSNTNSPPVTWTSTLVRTTFYNHFKTRDHTYYPSSSVVPTDDGSLLFTNAGMNQFKPIFLGKVGPDSELGRLRRVYNSQRCIRAGGKHNDLEDVGKDGYHHTFFEMLGNWSFGDYFKAEALAMAWELLTLKFKLSPAQLYVTYFGGDSSVGLEPDYETRDIWLRLGVEPSRILPFGSRENFWEMGEQGPCGPCSEIHYDRLGGRFAGHLVNKDDGNVIELWNLVFIQYNRNPLGQLRPLPQHHVDTGLGLERLVSVLQNTKSNYDTDLFLPLFTRIQQATGARPYSGHLGEADCDGIDRAYRVVADHARALTFALLDGGTPSSEGRGYVIRRILRRGCRYAKRSLGATLGSFFSDLVDPVLGTMKGVYSASRPDLEKIKSILNEEELCFGRTLERGEQLFELCLNKAKKSGVSCISGLDAFKLYDTYGFPIDLTKLMAQEQGFSVDQEGFDLAQSQAKFLSRTNTTTSKESDTIKLDVDDLTLVNNDKRINRPNDDYKYFQSTLPTVISGLFYDHKLHQHLGHKSNLAIFNNKLGVFLERTNFYSESGGQKSDVGQLVSEDGALFVVEHVESFGGYILHSGYLKHGELRVGSKVSASYDLENRAALSRNHTSTHLLNLALRTGLESDSIDQKGSKIGHDRFRLDFNYKKPLNPTQLQAIEQTCRDWIQNDLKVTTKILPLEDARKISGLRAVFGEIYPDPVRVVIIGPEVQMILANPESPSWKEVSVELCGGTHVESTSQIVDFILVDELAVAKGIRRLVAITGPEAKLALENAVRFEKSLDELGQCQGETFYDKIKHIGRDLESCLLPLLRKLEFRNRLQIIKKQRDLLTKSSQQRQLKQVSEIIDNALLKKQDALVVEALPNSYDSKILTMAVAQFKLKNSHSLYLLSLHPSSGQLVHSCNVAPNHISLGLTAINWATQVHSIVGGKCGGSISIAQGISSNQMSKANLESALQVASRYAATILDNVK